MANFKYYERDGKEYDRITSITDYFTPPELVAWKVRTPPDDAKRISKLALKHGSKVDSLIRDNKEPGKSDDIEIFKCLEAYHKWREEFGKMTLIFPDTAYCDDRMIAGTPDVYWVEQETLIDIKSSKSLHEGYFFQVGGGYASFKHPFKIRNIAILRLDKELGEYAYTTNDKLGISLPNLICGFNGLLVYYRMYKAVQSTLKPKEKVYDGTA